MQHRHLPPAPVDRALRLRAGPGRRSALVVFMAVVAMVAVRHGPDAVAADAMMTPEASAGALASLPAKGLAAAIAEAGRIEVPSADPSEPLAVKATQAAKWTEGAYDVWHLTGGVQITQGATEAAAHEAVIWIERDAGDAVDDEGQAAKPRMRSVLVRMAGDSKVTSMAGGDAGPATVRGPRWTGRFCTLR